MHQLDKVYDVAVFGSGLSGFAAAVTLAESGSEVLLVDQRCVLGWEGTWAYNLDLADVTPGLSQRLADRLAHAGGLAHGRADAPILEITLDRMATDAKADLLYYAHPLSVRVAGDIATCVVVAGKTGNHIVQAQAFVDATEAGILWRDAGAALEPPCSTEARHVMTMSRVKSLSEPQALGTVGGAANVVLKPGVWEGDVVVEFDIPKPDVRLARRAAPDLLRALREGAEDMAGVVTQVASESFPLHAARGAEPGAAHPAAKNLFAAGPWTGEPVATLADRIRCGQRAAEQILHALPDLPAVEPTDAAAPAPVAPPAHEYDVVVCGGGTAGPFAAIAAAQRGAKTALIEPTSFLGGQGTGGGIHCYYHGVPGGIQDKCDERVEALTPLFGPAGGFHPEAKKVALQQLCEEAGVDLVFHTTVTGAQTHDVPTQMPAAAGQETGRRVTGVVTVGPEGSALYQAKVVVDSTGDGDVAFMAGADYTFGRETDGLPHAFSVASGRLSAEGQLLITNFDAGYVDPADPTDMTRARRLALSHYFSDRYEADSRLVYVAPLLGLRNSRQIVGDYRLTLSDEVAGRQFPDVIAYAYSHFDNHGFDYENESDEAMLWVWTLGNWRRRFGCEIPYRCLLPRGIEGLLVACRAISITHDAHNQLRMQRDMQRLGEAAGTAAALAVQSDTMPRQVDMAVLQKALLESGALGERERAALPAPEELDLHEDSWVPPHPPAMPLQECADKLGSEEEAPEAAWQLIRGGEEALPLLKAAAKSECPQTRTWASVALAMLRQPEGAPELIGCVKERRDIKRDALKVAPMWKSAMVLLGRLASADAVPAIVDVLADHETDLDGLVAAIRALKRIGDPSAAPAIEALLERTDLPSERLLQVSTKGRNEVRLDGLWQIELAAAEALAALGRARPDLIAKHRQDERAYVRNYADRIAGDTSA